MTEEQWFATADPTQMLRQIEERTSERKLRLMACAFCRRIWHLLPDDLSRGTVELCECVVDGLADGQPLWVRGGLLIEGESELIYPADSVALHAHVAARFVACCLTTIANARLGPEMAASGASQEVLRTIEFSGRPVSEEAYHQCEIIRDIAGNPFRPVAAEAGSRDDTVIRLAEHIYLSRDFGAMPILADALQDAGCDSDDILDHCRDAHATHVRGCWVVDLVLGKS